MKDEKMKDKEMWMDKLKEKLENYSEPIPPFGWEQLEKELVPPVKKRILYPYRRWGAAAAVLLVAVSSLSIYFLNSPTADDIRHTVAPVLASDPDLLPPTSDSDMQVARVEPVQPRPVIAQVMKVSDREDNISSAPAETVAYPVEEGGSPMPEAEMKENLRKETKGTEEETGAAVRSHQRSGQDKLHIPAERPQAKKRRWTVGAAVGNGGGSSFIGNGTAETLYNSSSDQRLSLAPTVEDEIIQIPNNQMVVFKEGVPYLKRTDEIVDIKHHQPVSFGLSVRKGLAKGFSIETGVTYTLLSSDVQTVVSDAWIDQKLHYIGIPVRADWSFFDKDRFTLYVAAGGMVEKCVYGKLGNDKLTVNPLQFSVFGAVGAQFNATKHIGVYVEPGVAYFFDDGSDVQTIRKDTPFNFNLQAGIRFTY